MNEPLLGFPRETFVRRRERALELLQGGSLLLPASPLLHRSRDTSHRYRPDSELFYLTGCVDPGVVALLRDSDEHPFVLFVPEPDAKAERWSGPRIRPEEARQVLGADAVYTIRELEERLPPLLRSKGRVYFRLGVHPDLERLVIEALGWSRGRGSRTGEGPRTVVDPGAVLDPLRLIKDGDEIGRIRQATELTVAAFRETLMGTRPGMGEWEVEAILESAFRRGGAAAPAFPTIVGSGENGCILHYTANGASIQDGTLVLLDGGAEVDLYCADVTRTFPSCRRFLSRQRDVYEVVLRAHRAAIREIRPGCPVSRIHDRALLELTRGLVDLGVLKGSVGDLLEEKAYEVYFPHQTSHWLGSDVHDVGDYAANGTPRSLEEGMVLTVEPGLYFLPSQEGPSHPFSGIGVRIEDDILVTEEGAENLTRALPVEPEDMEELVGSSFPPSDG